MSLTILKTKKGAYVGWDSERGVAFEDKDRLKVITKAVRFAKHKTKR